MINRPGYTSDEIHRALHASGGTRHVSFRYDLLNQNEVKIGELEGVTAARVSHSTYRAIKRTAAMTIRESIAREIDFLTDRICPWFILHMPDGGQIEYPFGMFLAQSPKRAADGTGITREIAAYDKTLVLHQYRMMSRVFFSKGSSYVAAIKGLIAMAGISDIRIEDCGHVFPFDYEIPMGTSCAEAVSTLLTAINYTDLSIDVAGHVISEPFVPPARRGATLNYSTRDNSVITPGIEEELDIAGLANVFIRVANGLELDAPLKAIFTNDDPSSPLSTIRRGRSIVDFGTISNVANQSALDGLVHRLAIESTSGLRWMDFSTLLMPHHGDREMIFVDMPEISEAPMLIEETSWDMDLRVGGLMQHVGREIAYL